MDFLYKPWPWYVAGPLIGLTVPLLLLLGNKKLGISSTLRQICAACIPAHLPLLTYDWRRDSWNLIFALGLVIGGGLGGVGFFKSHMISIFSSSLYFFQSQRVCDSPCLIPAANFNLLSLFSIQGIFIMIAGRYL